MERLRYISLIILGLSKANFNWLDGHVEPPFDRLIALLIEVEGSKSYDSMERA